MLRKCVCRVAVGGMCACVCVSVKGSVCCVRVGEGSVSERGQTLEESRSEVRL